MYSEEWESSAEVRQHRGVEERGDKFSAANLFEEDEDEDSRRRRRKANKSRREDPLRRRKEEDMGSEGGGYSGEDDDDESSRGGRQKERSTADEYVCVTAGGKKKRSRMSYVEDLSRLFAVPVADGNDEEGYTAAQFKRDGEEEAAADHQEEEDMQTSAGLVREDEKKSRGGGARGRRFDVDTFQSSLRTAAGGSGAAATEEEAAAVEMGRREEAGEGERDGLFDVYCRLNYMRTHEKKFKSVTRCDQRNREIDELQREIDDLKALISKRNAAARAETRGRQGLTGNAAGGRSGVSSSTSSSLRVLAVDLELRRRKLARLKSARSIDLRDDLNLLLQNIDEQLLQLLPCRDSLELRAQKLDRFSWKTPMWIGYRPLLLLKHKRDYYSQWLQHGRPDPPHRLLHILQQQQSETEQNEIPEEHQNKSPAATDVDAAAADVDAAATDADAAAADADAAAADVRAETDAHAEFPEDEEYIDAAYIDAADAEAAYVHSVYMDAADEY